MPKPFWVIDAESDPFLFGRVPVAFIWGAYNGSEYLEFNSEADLVAFMRTQDAIFYAHNGGKFDFHFLAPWINQNETILMINSRLVKARIGKAEIRDSYALLPFPLRSYKKDDIDYSKLEKSVRHLHMPEIRAYLKNDCIYLWDLIAAFFAEYGRHLTAPGAAIKQLMKIEGLKVENSGQEFFVEFQKHYYGGRCECLAPGSYNEDLTYLDINSAYAYAMQHQHPIGTEYEFKYYKSPPIIPYAFYTVECESYGALCYKDRTGLHFDWKGERRIYHTTGWELKAGMETGRIKNVTHLEQKFFAENQTFEKFINHFWAERQRWKKGTPQNLFAKLIMNASYGKMASNPQEYDTFVLFDPQIAKFVTDNGWEPRGELGPHLVCSRPIEEDMMRFYNVATGASITGFVRAMLMRAISQVDNPIYCDTDSLIFTGDHSLNFGDELGQWKIEGLFSEGHFAGKKLYAVKNKDETKTASKGSKLDFEKIKRIAQGETILYNPEAPTFSWFKNPSFTSREIKRTA